MTYNIQLWNENHPGIKIVTSQNTPGNFFQRCSTALNTIRSQPVGKGLLKTIAAKCAFSDKSVFIAHGASSVAGTMGDPHEAYGHTQTRTTADADGNVVTDSFYVPGAGQSASLAWDPDDPGPPYAPRPSFIGLAHELIHAYLILHGLQYQSVNNTMGLAINEARVVGLGRFNNEPFTENAIRAEHNGNPRTQYLKGGVDYAQDPVVTGANPIPTFSNADARPR